MKFSDVIKKSFIEGFSGEISTTEITITLLITCALALYIFAFYRIITRKTFYSKTFNISLAVLAVITAAIILTIQSNIVVSLGMVGALSIVRFRTAIKDPMDLIFLFWSISIGIICGAGLAEVAILCSVFVSLLILVLDKVPLARVPMILTIQATCLENVKDNLLDIVEAHCKYYKVKAQTISGNNLNLVLEVRTNDELILTELLSKEEQVLSVSLLSHDGEATYS